MAYYFNNGKYHNSIFYFIGSILKDSPVVVNLIKYIIYAMFVSLYVVTIIKLLKKTQIDFSETIKKYHLLLMIFVLLIITNFYLWYLIWVFPTVFWLDKKQIKDVIYLGLGGQVAYQCTFLYIGEYDFLGFVWFGAMIFTAIVVRIIDESKNIKTNNERISEKIK